MQTIAKLNFEGNAIHELKWKGKSCWIAIDVARAAGARDPATTVHKFLKDEDFLVIGEDYDLVDGNELSDLKQLIEESSISVGSRTPRLTLFYLPALTHFTASRRGKVGKRLKAWIHKEVIPSIRKTGRYDISEQDSMNILDKQNRPTQLNLSKEIATYLIEMFGEQAIPVYHNLTHLGFVGKTAKELVAFANTLGVPKDVLKRGGREVLRYVYPEIPPCEAMQDELVTQGLSMDKAHESARKLVPFFQDMKKNGMLKSASITTQLGLVPTPNYQSIKNPFTKLPKALIRQSKIMYPGASW